jgi:glycyl-tRNA synthetase
MSKNPGKDTEKMDALVSLCKRRGFIFQGSEIYGGLAGTWDYAPLGLALKNNIKKLWWKQFVDDRDDMYGIDTAILMNQNVWKASGHVGGFSDPLVEDVKTKRRFRADHLLEENGVDPKGMTAAEMDAAIKEKKIKSPDGNAVGEVRQFNMMFKTHVGAIEDETSISYLRPETAQGMFVNFKNILDTFHPKLPFGIAQIGKAFRNEIAPRDFTFRSREFEQMEIEYFVDPRDEKKVNEKFEELYEEQQKFLKTIGLSSSKIHKLEVAAADRAHYSRRSVDTEFDFIFGDKKELLGIAYRTDYDLKAHIEMSGADLSYFDEEKKERFVAHCIEPTFGVDRLVLATLSDAYTEDELGSEGSKEDEKKEKRVFLRLAPSVAPFKVAVFPLLKNKPQLVEKAEAIYKMIKKEIPAATFDDNGNIGKRYRRQDEIGTPFCVTVDFETLEKGTGVTIRDRDTGTQERIGETELLSYLKKKIG